MSNLLVVIGGIHYVNARRTSTSQGDEGMASKVNIDLEIQLLSNHMFAPKGRTGVTPRRARQAAQAVIDELNELRDIVALIDKRCPRAD